MGDQKKQPTTSGRMQHVSYRYAGGKGSPVLPPLQTSITGSIDPRVELKPSETLNPYVGSTTDGDTESSRTHVYDLSMEEAVNLTSHDLIRWIAGRIAELRSTRAAWATLASQKKAERGATIAEAEWFATETTQGYADSIPFEIETALKVLESKLGGSTKQTEVEDDPNCDICHPLPVDAIPSPGSS